MRLDDVDPSENARDLGTAGGGFGGGGFGGGGGGLGPLIGLLPMLFGRRLGCGGILLIVIVGFFLMNSGMFSSSNLSSDQGTRSGSQSGNVAGDTPEEQFAMRVLGSTEQVWGQLFRQQGAQYRPATLNFYSRQNQSGCGTAQSAMGPFYCPADQGVYLDTAFFRELQDRFGAGGASANAYVIAHEVGHHIQTLTGISNQVRQAQSRGSEAEGNAIQVRMELQADCYAGVWAKLAKDRNGQPIMEPGDVEQAMRAAHAIGDDTLMQQAGQRPVESMFTHGSSEQRMRWLQRGLQSGDPNQCDTFQTRSL